MIKNKKKAAPKVKKPSPVEACDNTSADAAAEVDDEDTEAKKADDTSCTSDSVVDGNITDVDGGNQEKESENNTGAAVKDVDVVNLELSAIVNYVQPVSFKSLDESLDRGYYHEMSSFSEDRGMNHVRDSPVEFVQYNINQMSRIYPRGSRVDSNNYQPQSFWNCGSQMVALNYQTTDIPMQLNIGKFALNGNCGYLLKPKCFTTPTLKFDPFGSVHNGVIPHELSLEIISGQYLCKRKCSVTVEVDIFGVPPDVCLRKLKTKPSKDNAINPQWECEIIKKRKIIVPEMATIRLAAVDDRGVILGVRFLPVHLMQPGYRHIPLLNRLGKPSGFASLFCRIHVKDFVSEEHAIWVDALVNPLSFLEKHKSEAEDFRDSALDDLNADDERPVDEEVDSSKPNAPSSPSLSRFRALGHAVMLSSGTRGSRTSVASIEEFSTPVQPSRSMQDLEKSGGCSPGSTRPPLPCVAMHAIREHRDYVKFQRKQTRESQEVERKYRAEVISRQKQRDETISQLNKRLEKKLSSFNLQKEKAVKKAKVDAQFTASHFDSEMAKLQRAHQSEVQHTNNIFATNQADLAAKHKTELLGMRRLFAREEERVMVKIMKQIQASQLAERKAIHEKELKDAREMMVSNADASPTVTDGGDRGWQRRVTVAAVVSKIQTLGREHEEDLRQLEEMQQKELDDFANIQKHTFVALSIEHH